jgi:hypothetical protein
MNKKLFFTGMLAIMLVFGLVLTACGKEDDETPAATNPFVGAWSGNFRFAGAPTINIPATITIGETSWAISAPSSEELNGATGTYSYSGNVAALKDSAGEPGGTATVSGSTLTIVVPEMTGTFTK